MELELAIKRGLRIIPLLIDDAQMPEGSDLPESLRPILNQQGMKLSDDNWNSDIIRILRAIGLPSSGDRLSFFIQNTPHPAYIFTKFEQKPLGLSTAMGKSTSC